MQGGFLLKYKNEIYSLPCNVNKRGFTLDEAISTAKCQGWEEYELICIREEIRKYNLQGDLQYKDILPTEVYEYKTWYDAYMDNNINGFSLPTTVKTNECYIKCLKCKLEEYCEVISKPAFVYEDGLINEVKNTCSQILDVLKSLIKDEREDALLKLKNIIGSFINNRFFVSTLDESYSFRGIAPFMDLRSQNYDDIYHKMSEENLCFFRVRTDKKSNSECISEKKHIVHLPYSMKEKASAMRFSKEEVPCLYLGTTSFVCGNECKWDSQNEDMYASAFIPNEEGKKLKVLNLTISQALINGIYNRGVEDDSTIRRELQISMIKIFPLVIATSFSITQDKRDKKYEYLISQMLMEIINEFGIDGIAYLSMQGSDEFQYPQGVNLALPAIDISEKRPYSKYCEMFNMTLPYRFEEQDGEENESYINKIYNKPDSFASKIKINNDLIFYGETPYGKFDNWLVSQKMSPFVGQ